MHQYYDGNNNQNVTGDHIVNCKNCIECYDSARLEDCGYLIFSFNSKDCFDGHVVVDNCQLCYGTISTINQYNTQFTFVSFYSKNSIYLDHCQYSQECFGCSGLKRQKYCILNKQYSKDDYENMRSRIITHMKETGEWGTPLPPQLSPFGYNETVAQEYFPMDEASVKKTGWKWRDSSNNNESVSYQGPKTEVPVNIKKVDNEIVDKILSCEKCLKPYKVIPHELKLYRQHNMPLPSMCFDDRHMERIKKRNPRKLWVRNCGKCSMELQSTYAPDRPESIYCEDCYLKNMYGTAANSQ